MATFREAVLAALAEGARLVEEATVSAALLETEIAKRESAESCERCGAVLPPPYDRPEWAKSVAARHPTPRRQAMTEPPIARYRLTLTIKGNTLDEIEDRLATQVNGGFLLDSDYGKRDSWNSTDGTTTSVMEHHNPDMTPERYAAELDAWWTARNAERKADANG